ncbi:MAG: thioredoxin family protein [Rhodocyclaceae bacterium]|nr:thioredoxin family protein [Rhodocyclaceae bacterium]
MAALNPPICDFGTPAPDFVLPDSFGRNHTLHNCRGPKGLLVIFMCNHCPYVKAVIDRIVRDTRELATLGIGSVAIMSNDVTVYPEDSPKNMQAWAQELNLPFPYLYDETQSVARAFGAVCTPDYFGYNAQLELQYRGRLDASGRNPAAPDARRELFAAMQQITQTSQGPSEQHASIGCSIKWKQE